MFPVWKTEYAHSVLERLKTWSSNGEHGVKTSVHSVCSCKPRLGFYFKLSKNDHRVVILALGGLAVAARPAPPFTNHTFTGQVLKGAVGQASRLSLTGPERPKTDFLTGGNGEHGVKSSVHSVCSCSMRFLVSWLPGCSSCNPWLKLCVLAVGVLKGVKGC